MKRRDFTKKTAMAGVGLGFMPYLKMNPISANERIRYGVIGANGMGWSNISAHLRSIPEVECVAIADVDQNVWKRREKDYIQFRKNKIDFYGDYRKMLERDDIDAIIVGTPDHWHCKNMVDAVESGKHVFVEKPVANTIEECYIMMNAAKKSGKIVQVGQWQRSGPHYQKAREIVQSGVLGNIRLVKVWAYQGWMKPVPVLPDKEAPDHVDYKMWLGPAPTRPFNENRFHFNFRWFWDYAGGLMTDWGVHEIDIALWVMGAEAPISVVASGGKLAYPDDASETPDTLQALFQYENFNMLWEHATGIDGGNYGRTEGIAFIGNNGTLVVNRGGFEVIVEKKRNGWADEGKPAMDLIEAEKRPDGVNYLALHCQNFVKAMKTNDASILNTPIESGSIAAINAQMGNIAYKTGRRIYWDQKSKSFKNDKDANALISVDYNNGWEKPDKYLK